MICVHVLEMPNKRKQIHDLIFERLSGSRAHTGKTRKQSQHQQRRNHTTSNSAAHSRATKTKRKTKKCNIVYVFVLQCEGRYFTKNAIHTCAFCFESYPFVVGLRFSVVVLVSLFATLHIKYYGQLMVRNPITFLKK